MLPEKGEKRKGVIKMIKMTSSTAKISVPDTSTKVAQKKRSVWWSKLVGYGAKMGRRSK